jgi:hypothetical protein
MMTRYSTISPRMDAELALSGAVSKRAYVRTERNLVRAVQKFFRNRHVAVLGYEGIVSYSPRITDKYVSSKMDRMLNDVEAAYVFKCILRNYFWAFLCVNGHIGVYVNEMMSITFSNLSQEQADELRLYGLELEARPDLEEDDIYLCSSHSAQFGPNNRLGIGDPRTRRQFNDRLEDLLRSGVYENDDRRARQLAMDLAALVADRMDAIQREALDVARRFLAGEIGETDRACAFQRISEKGEAFFVLRPSHSANEAINALVSCALDTTTGLSDSQGWLMVDLANKAGISASSFRAILQKNIPEF